MLRRIEPGTSKCTDRSLQKIYIPMFCRGFHHYDIYYRYTIHIYIYKYFTKHFINTYFKHIVLSYKTRQMDKTQVVKLWSLLR